MQTLGILVGERGNWTFFEDIHASLQQRYTTNVYREKTYNTALLHGRLNRWAFRNRIKSILRTSDVCFFEWASELLLEASRMEKTCPVVARLHSYEIFAWAPQIEWNFVDKVILVSKAMERNFHELYPDHAHKTEVVYNGAPLDRFRVVEKTGDGPLTMGMLCSINPRKRVYETVLMMDTLRKRGIDARLKIAGGRVHAPDMDEYYVAVHRLVESLDLGDRVTVSDHTKDTPAFLADVDVFISNSYWEGQQVALLEAMACGCYCFSHRWAGAEEVLPEDSLFYTEAELVEKIEAYLRWTPAERAERSAAMRASAEKTFDLSVTTARIHDVIAGLLSNRLAA